MDPKLSPAQQASAEQYPITTGISRVGGEIATTAPALAAATYALPEAGALSLPLLVGRGLAVGAGMGGAQSALTAGEQFEPGATKENLLTRVGKGMFYGAPFGALGGGAEWALGAGETIAPEIQRAGQEMANSGVNVTAANLPRAGAPVGEFGAPATAAQVGQINRAWGNIFGENTPDFSPATVSRVIPKLGEDVGNAVRAGKLNYDAVLPSGETFEQKLADIEASATPENKAALKKLIGSIVSKVDNNNEISGDALAELLRTGNPLDLATREGRMPVVSIPANQIEGAVKDAFTASSPPGASQAYSLAREKYKLALVGQRAANETTGDLDPGKLMAAIRQMYPDAKQIGTGTSLTDQAINFARNANRLFGGSAPAQPASSWTIPALLGPAAEAGLHFGFPTMAENPLIAGALVGGPLAARALSAIHRGIQETPAFARNLLMRGQSGIAPYAPAFAGSAVGSAR